MAQSATVTVLADLEHVVARAAEHIAGVLQAAIAARGRAALVLSGGSAAPAFLGRLAVMPADTAPDWQHVTILVADERYVPSDHDDNNGGMIRRALLNYVSVPADQFFPVATYYRDAQQAAAIYSKQAAAVLQAHDGAFDLVVLGMGPDGHTASLFPGHAALQLAPEIRAWAINDSPKPPPQRVTLTAATLSAARDVLFVATGAEKAPALARAISAVQDALANPTRLIRPTAGTVHWIVDQAAAAHIADSAAPGA